MKSFLYIAALCVAIPAISQTVPSGTLEIYRTTTSGYGGIPLLLDSQCKLKIGGSGHLTLQLTAGEHQLESKLGRFDPIVVVMVGPGETSYVILDLKRPTVGSLLIGKPDMTLTLERTNATPEGKYKNTNVSPELLAMAAALPPFHETMRVVSQREIVSLTDAEVSEALLQGRHTPAPSTIGLYLEDYGQQFASGISDGQAVSGFSVRVFTAKQWLQLQSAVANRELRPFSEADVTPKMRQRLMWVIARPSTPANLNGRNMAAADNVQRIVLEEGLSKAVIQPVTEEPSTVNLESALRSATYLGLLAAFPEPDTKLPFAVIVVGDSGRKTFQVKEKHLARLK